MNIVPKLNLNKHPKDCDNLSLNLAKNMMISGDISCLTNEPGIENINSIEDMLSERFNSGYKIIGYIPCNNEVVLFVNGVHKGYVDKSDHIFRYREKDDTLCYFGNNWKWSGGKIKGTFTYNVENDLIVAIAEYGVENKDIPLKTINLGHFASDDSNEIEGGDKDILDNQFSISPEVKISKFTEHNYVAGAAYKGWYYIYIRYKINKNDYTQWFSIGYPIFVDTLIRQEIFRYCYPQKHELSVTNTPFTYLMPKENTLTAAPDGYCAGFTDSFSNTSDIANESFAFNIVHDENIPQIYSYYQIGVVCASKSYTKSWRTSDILINSTEYKFDIKQLIETDLQSFIEENYNYFNVRNIINYKNRLYISNYKEHALNKYIADDISEYISLSLHNEEFSYVQDGKNPKLTTISIYNTKTNNNIAQYFVESVVGVSRTIPLSVYLNVDGETRISLLNADNDTEFVGWFKAKDIKIEPNNTNESIPDYCRIRYNSNQYINKKAFYKIADNEYGSYNEIPLEDMIIATAVGLTDPNNNFVKRKELPTLIPGEVYNFFIHFVDKYGHVTNGYRINNDNFVKISGSDIHYSVLRISKEQFGNHVFYYVAVPEDITMKDIYKNISEGGTYSVYNDYDNGVLSNEATFTQEDLKNCLIQSYGKLLTDEKYNYLKAFQCFNNATNNFFGTYINNNGERLFRVPDTKYKPSLSLMRYTLNANCKKLPTDYIGWFISYEKFESLGKVTGFLTRSDFRTNAGVKIKGQADTYDHYTANQDDGSMMFFYSSKFDISDSLQLDYNILKTEFIQTTHTGDVGNAFTAELPNYDRQFRNIITKYCYDYNKALSYFNADNLINDVYAIPKYSLIVANSAKDDRAGLGTGLQIESIDNLFNVNTSYTDTDKTISVYIATLYNHTTNLYMSKNKELIRISEIFYNTGYVENIYKGLNGFITYDGVIIYENPGLFYNASDYTARRRRGVSSRYYPEKLSSHVYATNGNIPMANYVQFPCYDTYFYESKQLNNAPQAYEFPIVGLTSEDFNAKSFWVGKLVEPKNSIDLFANPQGSADDFNIKKYGNYREDILSVEQYDKTVRRSNVIQDESRINAWRTFPVEGYKNITENKGIITNLVGIGTYILVHTEHSLFMFNGDSTLKTEDKNIQLSQPDAFDTNYVEVFTSDHGYGGLQDDLSFVVDQFGYIFYNNDFRQLFQFDNGKLNIIDQDIVLWLKKVNPRNVRFANDKFNKRILIKFDYGNTDDVKADVISYHYDNGGFVSLHDYYFTDAFNTKTKLYLLNKVNSNASDKVYRFREKDEYGVIPSAIRNLKTPSKFYVNPNGTYASYINVIINSEYEVIKLLEFIKYKLRKIADTAKTDFAYSPVEDMQVPYAGDFIRIYNDLCDTGFVDVSVEVYNPGDYKKPWFELGNWNFNYFRNNIDKIVPNSKDIYTRIYGNFFIIQFRFTNKDKLRIEFENLDGSVVKNRQL